MNDAIDKDQFKLLIDALEKSARDVANANKDVRSQETAEARLQVRRDRVDTELEAFEESETAPPDQFRALLDEFQEKARLDEIDRRSGSDDEDWERRKEFQEVHARLLRVVDQVFLENAFNDGDGW